VSACSAEVPFAEMLTAGRAAIEREVERPAPERLRRHAALAVLPRSGRIGSLGRRSAIPHYTAAQGASRGRVGLLLGCTQRATDSKLHQTTLAVLAAEGYEVIAPRLPDCCGALELHSGDQARGLRRAQLTIDAFAAVGGVDHVITSAGTCGAALKDYGRLLGTPEAQAFSALALDVHELLARAPLRSRLGPLAIRIVYHDSCQLRHAQGVARPPRELLERIPGLQLLELAAEAGACCGSPGLYRVMQPEAAAALGRRQAEALLRTGAELAVSADHACTGQLERHLRELGSPLAVHHPLEVLARSIEAGRRADGPLPAH